MNEKIKQFLNDAGFEGSDQEPAALQLLRYFESEYGVSLLPLLEKEWLDEQLHKDVSGHDFKVLRGFIDDQHLNFFDQTLAEIEAYD